MKYIILLGDGMADEPLAELDARTPLEVAQTPYMDSLASQGELGLVCTVKKGFPPGSDVANMTVLGLDPSQYYTGRAPIEAVSMGVDLAPTDTAFRINLVTITPKDGHLIMEDYCSDHITTDEARELIVNLRNRGRQSCNSHVSGHRVPAPHGHSRLSHARLEDYAAS